jgi:hypothetical protein
LRSIRNALRQVEALRELRVDKQTDFHDGLSSACCAELTPDLREPWGGIGYCTATRLLTDLFLEIFYSLNGANPDMV